MSVKIVSSNEKSITLEVTIDMDNENFLQTEEGIMNSVNELGKYATQQAMQRLDIKEQKLYAKNNKKNIKPLMEK
jgi:hypothetical protein